MDEWGALTLGLVGIAGGFANTVAGGASLMSLPVLLSFGLPVPVALATNKLGTSGQAIFTSYQFHRKNQFDWGAWRRAVLPCALGAWFGANLVLQLPDAVLKFVVSGVLVLAFWLTFRSQKIPVDQPRQPSSEGFQGAVFSGIGLYGGFFGGGVGLLLVPVIHRLEGLNLVRANAVKAGLAAGMNVTALGTFLYQDIQSGAFGSSEALLRLEYGAALLAGMVVGARAGVHVTLKRGEAFVKAALLVATAVSLLFLFR